MKVLIIGGNGYVGSALYSYLKNQSIDIDSVDLCLFGENLSNSIEVNYNNFYIKKYSHIVLLAAHSSVKMANYDQQNAWLNNVTYFYDLCTKLSNEQVLIYASSASVYGRSEGISTEDKTNLFPVNNYDLTKITNDIIANKFISEGKNIIGLRFGTVNGVSENIRSDLMINSMYYSSVVNSNIKIKNAKISRPILAIKDLVRCIETIINSKPISGQYNLTSFNMSVEEISDKVSKVWNVPIIDEGDDDYSTVYDFRIDNSLFCMSYNFEFTETIENIANDLKEHNNVKNFLPRNDDGLFASHI